MKDKFDRSKILKIPGMNFSSDLSKIQGDEVEIILPGVTDANGKVRLVNDFETWKIKENNPLPSAKEAWDAQEVTIQDLQSKLIIASNTLKRSRAIINELKQFVEGNFVEMQKLEDELAKKDELIREYSEKFSNGR